jgi:hypothetical protein
MSHSCSPLQINYIKDLKEKINQKKIACPISVLPSLIFYGDLRICLILELLDCFQYIFKFIRWRRVKHLLLKAGDCDRSRFAVWGEHTSIVQLLKVWCYRKIEVLWLAWHLPVCSFDEIRLHICVYFYDSYFKFD